MANPQFLDKLIGGYIVDGKCSLFSAYVGTSNEGRCGARGDTVNLNAGCTDPGSCVRLKNYLIALESKI